jgi:serine/threonine protein kinase
MRLEQLLDPSAGDSQQRELIGHLDRCNCCQQALEEMARGNAHWPESIRNVERDRPASQSAFWPALAVLEKDLASPAETTQELQPVTEVPLDFLRPSERPDSLGRLGQFEITEVIGRGGMGIVLKAFDPCLQRFVALKVLDPQYSKNEAAMQRFCREARAAAQVTHEHVVAIHAVDHDEESDVPYLVMQLVSGVSLQERLDHGQPLPLRDVVRIGAQMASGLAAAHAQGLIHRDIKPANILLENSVGGVKLTDFGLARAAEDVKITQTGFVAGTPLYMAPEQARGEALDQRADLFSLGSVLYAMCTGQAPFEGSTPYIVLKRVTEENPRPVRELNPTVPDWLVALIDKLLAKDPAKRFQSSAEVAELLWHHLATLPPSRSVPGMASSNPEHRTAKARSSPPSRRWMISAALPWLVISLLALTESLGVTHLTSLFRGGKSAEEPDQSIANFPGGGGPVWSVAFSPDGRTLAMGTEEGSVKLWDVESKSLRLSVHAHQRPVWTIAFFGDGKFATGSSDMTVKIWSADGEEHRQIKGVGLIRALALSQDGKRLVSGGRDGAVRIWDVATGTQHGKTNGHDGEVTAVAISADGRLIASGSSDKTAKIWDAATGRELGTLAHRGTVYTVAFSPDGKTLASGGWDKIIRLSDVATASQRSILRGHAQDVRSLAFSPDGRTLASGSEDWTVKLWDLATEKERQTLHGQKSAIYCLAFSPDGEIIATGGRDGTARLWDGPR